MAQRDCRGICPKIRETGCVAKVQSGQFATQRRKPRRLRFSRKKRWKSPLGGKSTHHAERRFSRRSTQGAHSRNLGTANT